MRRIRGRRSAAVVVVLTLAGTSAACATGPEPLVVPAVVPDVGTSADADRTPDIPTVEGTPRPEPEPAATSEAAADPSPFTTTSPRGPVDTSRWPTEVRIAAIEVAAPVEPVGVGTSGALIIPDSPRDVGWYQGGSLPGEPGVALLTSHLDTRREGRGVFAGLVELEIGDGITLAVADGSTQRWTVTRREQHRKDALPQELFARSGTPELALVTCGGPFDRTARSYRDNVIVWATLSD